MNIDIDLCLPYREYENRHKIFDALLDNIEDGMTFTLTPSNIATGDHFLIFSAYKKQTITIHTDNVPYCRTDRKDRQRIDQQALPGNRSGSVLW